ERAGFSTGGPGPQEEASCGALRPLGLGFPQGKKTKTGEGLMDSNLKGAKPVMPELAKLDATAQAELVAKGELTALDLVEAGISRIEQVNGQVNAVVATFYDKAREAAKGKLPQGPFTGVPNLVKDLDNLKGTSATSGSRFLAQNVSPET